LLGDIFSSLLDLLSTIAVAIWRRPAWRRAAGLLLLALLAVIGVCAFG